MTRDTIQTRVVILQRDHYSCNMLLIVLYSDEMEILLRAGDAVTHLTTHNPVDTILNPEC